MFKLVAALSVIAVTTATQTVTDERPVVQGPKFPHNGWGILDWSVGLTMGAYGPLNAYARDQDCFAAWFTWGVGVI